MMYAAKTQMHHHCLPYVISPTGDAYECAISQRYIRLLTNNLNNEFGTHVDLCNIYAGMIIHVAAYYKVGTNFT